jgi:transglutaminase-like putative cysteine protease
MVINVLKEIARPYLQEKYSDDSLYLEKAWDRRELYVSRSCFGNGNENSWEWYFDGKSSVNVSSLDDICSWLSDCEYILDRDLFNKEDFWQHPVTLEHTRKGDCEDQALWAWRKMAALGVAAEFVVGFLDADDGEHADGHAWLIYEHKGQRYIFEATGESQEDMILLFDDHHLEYIPEFSIDFDFRTYVFKQGLSNL